MFLKQAALFLIGSSAGGIISAGVYAFLAVIGVFPRVFYRIKEEKHILLYETLMILGGVYGTIIDLYHAPRMLGGVLMLIVWGLSIGVFVGCLVMSLAETLKALPVFARRIRLSEGLQYVIASVAAGKFLGSMIYFIFGFGST